MNDRPRPKRPTSFALDDAMRDRLEEIAEAQHVSLGEVIRGLIEDSLRRKEDDDAGERSAGG